MTNRHSPASRFEAHWLTHTVRLKDLEASHRSKQVPVFPSLSDSRNEVDAQNWLIQRAYDLNRDSATLIRIQQWLHNARFLLALLLVLAIISGISAAIGFFGSEQRNVNVIWTLIGLIGVHFIAMLAWLFGGRLTGGWMGRISFWVMSRWPKSEQVDSSTATTLPRALGTVMSSNGLGKWSLSCITHSAWLVALLASLLTMLVVLSVRSYSFVLETTILSEAVFEQIVRAFAYLPSVVGFAVPSDEMIAAALGGAEAMQSDATRRAWASCLSGGLLVYAIIPRALVLLWSLLRFRLAYSTMRLDVKLPGFLELFAQTSASSQVVDAAPQALRAMQLKSPADVPGESLALVALELGAPLSWPPQGIQDSPNILLFDEIVETGAQQRAVLQVLQASPARRILIVCDARLSPDRGSLQWLIALSEFSGALAVCVLIPNPQFSDERREVWARSLENIGLASQCLFYKQVDGLTWLTANE